MAYCLFGAGQLSMRAASLSPLLSTLFFYRDAPSELSRVLSRDFFFKSIQESFNVGVLLLFIAAEPDIFGFFVAICDHPLCSPSCAITSEYKTL
jgi:hypothetical protein